MKDNKRVALYCRYSTHTQDGNYSIDIQLERMEAMCKSKGWQSTERFIDPAYSGANMERPALQELLNRIKEFDVVMVYRLDRLSRSQRDTMTLIQDHFLINNVAFVSVTETLDTTTPFGMAMIGILAVFAELERATITERMQAGIRKRIEDGYWQVSGDRMPTGYKKGKDENGYSILLVDEYEATKVQRIFDLYELTHSITEIQKQLKIEGYKSRKFSTIRQILSNRLYIGEVRYKNEHFPGVHEPLVSKKQFDRVQALLSRHPKGKNAGKAKESLFSNLIVCGCCGEKYTTYSYKVITKTKGNYYVRSYLCRARRFPSEYDKKCMNQTVKNDLIESLFIKNLDNLITNRKTKSVGQKRKTNYDLALRRVEEKISRLIDLYEDGEIDKKTLNNRIEIRNKEKEDIINKRNLEVANNALAIEINDLNKYLINFEEMDFISKRAIVEKVIERIIIEPDNIIFEWNF